MDFLTFDVAEVDDGVSSLEAMASTATGQHAAVMAEVQQVLDWAWSRFPNAHGPIDDGMEWDHDLQVSVEDGGWHTVTLTLTGTGRFVDEFIATFGNSLG
jgi:VCBS repeat-containing protein